MKGGKFLVKPLQWIRRPALYLFIGLAVITVALAIFINRSGVRVTVHNSGAQPLENVVIRTYQQSYPLGDIPPGGSAVKGVDVLGDSDLSITHIGRQDWQPVNTYITRGYVGEMKLELKGGEVVDFTDDLRIWP